MKRILLVFLVFSAAPIYSFGQQRDLAHIADSITNDGKALFRSEWASWYGTDIFLEKCKNKKDRIGGYVSYDTGRGLNNIFFSKDDEPVVLATTSFAYDFNADNFKFDTVERKLTPTELNLYKIRQAALTEMKSDTLFKFYKNTSLNAIPIISNAMKRVYFLTGPSVSGVVIFGNDYLIDFNNDNSIKTVNRLHKNIITVNYKGSADTSSKTDIGTMHTHLAETGDFITSTDICTLMLYEKFTTWNQHYVISKNYISIWDCKKNILAIMTMEAWKKISADQSVRKSLKN